MNAKFSEREQRLRGLLESMLSGDLTNGAAIGYMIMAARELELEHGTIRALESIMEDKMDFYSEDQAEREYMTFA